MGGKSGQSGRLVGFRTQPVFGETYADVIYSTTDNRVKCPYCNGDWFQVKDSWTIDDGALPPTMDGYGAAGTKNMIIFLCHCGREFGKECVIAGDDWDDQLDE